MPHLRETLAAISSLMTGRTKNRKKRTAGLCTMRTSLSASSMGLDVLSAAVDVYTPCCWSWRCRDTADRPPFLSAALFPKSNREEEDFNDEMRQVSLKKEQQVNHRYRHLGYVFIYSLKKSIRTFREKEFDRVTYLLMENISEGLK